MRDGKSFIRRAMGLTEISPRIVLQRGVVPSATGAKPNTEMAKAFLTALEELGFGKLVSGKQKRSTVFVKSNPSSWSADCRAVCGL